jgi:hypothetical protein
MRRALFAAACLLVLACGEKNKDGSPSVFEMSRTPVSVRGWIVDVKGAKRAEGMELEVARRTELFASSSVWVENTQYASGGIAENGAFIVLDVPPNNAILGFQAPGAENAQVVLENIPGGADVFIPDLLLESGGATVLDPKLIQVRLPSDDDTARDTGQTAKVAGYTVRVIATPYAQMTDRRDYPSPPGFRPVATMK